MPVMSGDKALRIIRDKYQDKIFVAAITASIFESSEQFIELGDFDEVIYKPFKVEEILNFISRSNKVKLIRKSDNIDISENKIKKVEIDDEFDDELKQKIIQGCMLGDYEEIHTTVKESNISKHSKNVILEFVDKYEFEKIIELLH